MTLSVAFSPSLLTQVSLAQLILTGVRRFYVPFFPIYWANEFGTSIQPIATPEITPVALEVYQSLFRQIQEAGGEVSAILDGKLSTPSEQEWLESALHFLNESQVNQIVVANPAIPLEFQSRFPHLSWIASECAPIYSSEAAQFWSDLGIYRIILPRQLSGAETLRIIHYATHLPIQFTIPLLNHPANPAQPFMRHWLEPDVMSDTPLLSQLLKKPDYVGKEHSVPPIIRYRYAKKIAEQGAFESAFSEDFPLRCGACFMGKLSGVPNLEWWINGVGLPANRLISYVEWITQHVIPHAALPERIQASLGHPSVCHSRQWCLYPDQLESPS